MVMKERISCKMSNVFNAVEINILLFQLSILSYNQNIFSVISHWNDKQIWFIPLSAKAKFDTFLNLNQHFTVREQLDRTKCSAHNLTVIDLERMRWIQASASDQKRQLDKDCMSRMW